MNELLTSCDFSIVQAHSTIGKYSASEGIPIKMKTVLHVIDTTGPGGAETIFLQLAKKVAENGHKSIALIRGSGWVQSQLEQLNTPFYVTYCRHY